MSDEKHLNDSCELVAHGDRFVYASEYEALEAESKVAFAAHSEAMYRAMADVVRVEADNAKLRETLREAIAVMENSGSFYTEGSTHDIAWDDARDSCVAKAREARKGVPQQWTRPTSTAKPETP